MRRAVGKSDFFAPVVKASIPYYRLRIDLSDDTAGFPNHQLARDRIGLTAAVVVSQPSHGLLVLGQEWSAQGFLISAFRRSGAPTVPIMNFHISRKILGYEGTIGTLKPGANADVALLERRAGNFAMTDSDGKTVTARERLIARTTIKDGRVWYERPGE